MDSIVYIWELAISLVKRVKPAHVRSHGIIRVICAFYLLSYVLFFITLSYAVFMGFISIRSDFWRVDAVMQGAYYG